MNRQLSLAESAIRDTLPHYFLSLLKTFKKIIIFMIIYVCHSVGLLWLKLCQTLITLVVIDVVKSLHGCDRELIFNVVSQLRSMQLPITSIWKQGTYSLLYESNDNLKLAYVKLWKLAYLYICELYLIL